MTQKGFTFIELILYVAILSMVLTFLVPFAWNVIGGSEKSTAQQEVFSQARFISERIKYETRNAVGINTVSSSSISLSVPDVAKNPTVIDLLSGNIRIKQGASAAVNLNSNTTTITALTFTNYSSADNKTKHIGFTFTVDDNYSGGRQEYEVSAMTIEGSAEIRSN